MGREVLARVEEDEELDLAQELPRKITRKDKEKETRSCLRKGDGGVATKKRKMDAGDDGRLRCAL